MNLYLDASALVKRYVAEKGHDDLATWWSQAHVVATTKLCFVEVHAALAKTVRQGWYERALVRRHADRFSREWPELYRLDCREDITRRAADLAWRRGLRGYDAVHLASALAWHASLDDEIRVATYDRQLWDAAVAEGVGVLPEERP
jgi:predicted nucleic acid-binding protein